MRCEIGAAVCQTCKNRRRSAQRTTDLHDRATATLLAWLPLLDADRVAAAVARAAPNLRQDGWLVDALVDVEVLHGSMTAPAVIDRLVAELTTAGATGIAAPRCVCCGRSDWLTQRLDGHRACSMCARRARIEICARCGNERGVAARDPAGSAVCQLCLSKDRSRWEPCSRCDRLARPARRLPDGSALCRACNRPMVVCVGCGQERPCEGVRSGEFRCEACSRRRTDCARCGRLAPVAAAWASGPVCSTCYHKALEAKATCDGCGRTRRPDPRHPSGRCADCLGLPAFQVCSVCGTEDRIYRKCRCWSCTLIDVFDTATVTTTSRATVVDLAALRASLLATDRPRAVVRWLETPFARRVLADLSSGELALTHVAIDSLGGSLAVGRLRSELGSAGLLPVRDEVLARLEAWVAARVDAIDDAEDRRVVDAFATWWVLRRARHRTTDAPTTNTRNARKQIARAIDLVAFLRSHHLTLATCTQADIDLWLTGPPSGRDARSFLRWAHRRGLCGELEIVHRVQAWPSRRVAPGAHEQIVRSLLTDESINLVDRVS